MRRADAARACAAACIAIACIAAAHCMEMTLCPMKRFLGVPCPTCGTTRAAVLMARGRFADAFSMQPLAVAALCVSAVLLPAAMVSARVRDAVRIAVKSPAVWVAVAVALLANWAYVVAIGN